MYTLNFSLSLFFYRLGGEYTVTFCLGKVWGVGGQADGGKENQIDN